MVFNNQQLNENLNLNAKLATMLKLNTNNTTNNNNSKSKLPSSNSSIQLGETNQINTKASTTTNGSSVNTTTTATTASNNGKILSNEDKKINLNALKNQDPFATNIIDTALRVAVYKFVSKKNEWVKIILNKIKYLI